MACNVPMGHSSGVPPNQKVRGSSLAGFGLSCICPVKSWNGCSNKFDGMGRVIVTG